MTSRRNGIRYRLAIDVGGTFTDLIFFGSNGLVYGSKRLSTMDDPSLAISQGVAAFLEERALDPAVVDQVVHATTVASNALLEHRGPRVGLVTTKGFRDILEIRRLRMPRLYDMEWRKPRPLVERYLREEVSERVDADGGVVIELKTDDVELAVRRLLRAGVESIAVCLLNAYANPEHEERIGEIISRIEPDLPVSLSSWVLPEIGEYERCSTTVVDAYIKPLFADYLRTLEMRLEELGIAAPLLIMQSNGGVMSARAAIASPIHVLESGPAAGVVGALHFGRRVGIEDIITFDMGGTTAKASIIEAGTVSRIPEYEVGGGMIQGHRLLSGGGYAVKVQAIDVAEVGAGGGSIAWIDRGQLLKVGPRSAGSMPGPVCYARGGTEPTVTDANVILGYLNPEALAGGSVPLDIERATAVMKDRICRPLHLEVSAAAHAIHTISTSNMLRAVRAVSSERGRSPQRFCLTAFGGSGPLHAVDLARELGITHVVIPPDAGLFTSLGLLLADEQRHFSQTYLRNLSIIDLSHFREAISGFEGRTRQVIAETGESDSEFSQDFFADMRYASQKGHLTVPMTQFDVANGDLAALQEAFEVEHERTFGYRAAGDSVQLLNIRMTLTKSLRVLAHREVVSMNVPLATRRRGQRPVYFGQEFGWITTNVIGRHELASVDVKGPLLIEEYDTTTIIPPDCRAKRDASSCIMVTVPVA